VARKIILILAALLVPGGLIALFGAWLIKVIRHYCRGRQANRTARRGSIFAPGPSRQAA
jgi:hypothetical protein